MEIATSQIVSRICRLALIGVATAFAWIVLTLLLGLGSGDAQAADDSDGKSVLGAVTSVVDETADAVTGTVTKVADGVTETVDKVVNVAPAPVQQPVREVVKTVGTVVEKVAEPVAEVVSDEVVTKVTEPVVDVVKNVPVVGDVVTAIGADKAVEDLTDTVDGTLDELVGAIVDTGASIGEPSTGTPALPPLVPGIPVFPASGGATDASGDNGLLEPAPRPSVTAGFAASALPAFAVAFEPGSVSAASLTTASTSSDVRGTLSPAGGLCPPSALSSGPGGAGPGAWALVALGPLAALRAWRRRVGPEDEHAPPAPAGSTDVSPD